MTTESEARWTNMVKGTAMTYPSEYVIRIFKGAYPRLDLDKASFRGKRICDIGCGDGRNLPVLKECGFDVYGVEVNKDIVKRVKENIAPMRLQADVRVGTNAKTPYEGGFFDYLLSWNACYYLGEDKDFDPHVSEFARILKNDGFLVLSIPKKTSFIYKGGDEYKPGYTVIRNDPFELRNGEVLRMFESEREIEQTFSPHFKNFIHGSIEDDCFGLDYHWHLVVCQKK